MTRMEALRVPPHSIEAEQAVLGGLMLRNEALTDVVDWLSEDDFYRRDHRIIYRAIKELATKNKPFDAVTLGEWFHVQQLASEVGGASYVIELANTTPSAANIVAYAEIVREKSALRKQIDIGMEMASAAFESKGRTAELIGAEAMQALAQLGSDSRPVGPASSKSIVGSWWADMQRRYDEHEDMSGLLTPWKVVNECTLGWQDGDLILIAGNTSMGKSVLGMQAATFNALRGKRTLVFSLEMRSWQLVQRSVSALSEIAHRALRKPSLITEAEWPKITEAATRISSAPLDIDDQPSLTPQQIVARAKRQHMRDPLTLIVIDHLHEVRRPGRDPTNELADATAAFRTLGKELGVPVILLAQLNRGANSRPDHRPNVGDLRGSGSIGEKADVIFLLHREDYYKPDTHLKGVIELIVGKARDMERGTLHLANRYDLMRADDWEGPLPEPKPKAETKAAAGKTMTAGLKAAKTEYQGVRE